MKKIVVSFMLLALGAQAQFSALPIPQIGSAQVSDNHFTIRFLSGTFPTNLVLGTMYTGPVAADAEYDSGDGIWRAYTSKNIPVRG